MKKLVSLLLSAALMLSLAACGGLLCRQHRSIQPGRFQ